MTDSPAAQQPPIGLSMEFKRQPPTSFSQAVDHALALGSYVAELPYRFPFAGESRRILELSGRDIGIVQEQMKRFDRVSFHGPIGNVFMTNLDVKNAVTNSLRLAIQEAALIGAEAFALHIEPSFPNLEFKENELKHTANALRDLAEFACCYHVKLCLETEYPNTIAGFLALIDAVDHPNFGATVDVGHLYDRRVPYHTYIDRELLRSPEGPHAYNEMLQSLTKELLRRGKLCHAHIHQQRREALGDPWPWGSCDHWTLDEGFIDIPAFFRLLRQGGYTGIVICELARGKNGPQAYSITDAEKAESLALAKKWWLEAAASAAS